MSGRQALRAVLIAVALLVAVGGFALLYRETQSVDFERHAAVVDALRSSEHRDERLKEEVLAVRFGLLSQYDPLARTAVDIEREVASLKSALGHVGPTSSEMSTALKQVDAARAKKRTALERFKRHNAVLKNSLAYLPVLGRQLSRDLAAAEGDHDELRSQIAALVEATLIFNLRGEASLRRDQKLQTMRLEKLRGAVPAGQATSYELLLTHAKTVAREQQVVDPLVEDVLDDGFAHALSRTGKAYNSEFAAAVAHSDRYREILYGWSVLLALLLLATAYKLRSLYRDLERRVVERTKELKHALGELWGEMQLAKKIQTALIPKAPTLRGCAVAAAMKPADDVGGDYYDVFSVDGTEWILMGDVSGHGVPAGLIMMMCQTATRAALAGNPDLAPDELLAVVNRALTGNIKRLDEKKYMTITALRRQPDGTMRYAGLHQDLFIYRSGERTVERVAQRGTWLGIVDRLEGKLPVDELVLDANDVLLLFTDGVTEARRNGELLDNDGLARIFEKIATRPVDQIVAEIMRELERFDVDDDISLLVIRQLEAPGMAHAS